jgi:DNA-binding PadR family transcriptional regulator
MSRTAQASPEDHLPLSNTVLTILLALADGEKHGYGIMQTVEAMTGSQMGPGTLYGAVKRLLKAGLIEETDDRPDPALDDQRRRYYQLTGFGRQVLEAEVHRLEVLIQLAHRKQIPGQAGS